MKSLQKTDPEIAAIIQDELVREQTTLEMIASENFTSLAVLEAQGSILTNKYAEGYPGKRYYGGCEHVDRAEELAKSRAQEIFGAEAVNVQPHSGSQANMAIYSAFLQPGDKILGMELSHGGHLTHGSAVNFSGINYQTSFYGVNKESERIDFEQVEQVAEKERPKLIIAGASAYPRLIDFERFRSIADKVGALFLVDMAHIAGLVAAKVIPSPVEHADFVTTTTHKTLRGPRGGLILSKKKYAAKINKTIFPGIQGGPMMHTIAAKAVCFHEAMQPQFQQDQQQTVANAKALGKQLSNRGFRLVSQGTDTHLLLVDLTPQNITGKEAENALEKAKITLNKNTIPFEQRSPFITSGIRIGTPALTTRGMKEQEMIKIADWIADILDDPKREDIQEKVASQVKELCAQYPLYQIPVEKS